MKISLKQDKPKLISGADIGDHIGKTAWAISDAGHRNQLVLIARYGALVVWVDLEYGNCDCVDDDERFELAEYHVAPGPGPKD